MKNIKKIRVLNENDKLVAVIKIDICDIAVLERISNLVREIRKIHEKQSRYERLVTKSRKKSRPKTKAIIENAREHIGGLNYCINEMDSLFGHGVIKNIYGADMPNEKQLLVLISQIVTALEELTIKAVSEK